MCQTNKIAGQVSEDMIGCLCWFYVDREQKIGILTDITKLNIKNSDTYYIDDCGHHHLSCRPVKPDEVRFYESPNGKLTDKVRLDVLGLLYSARTEKIDELVQKMHELKKVFIRKCPDMEEWINKHFGD